jgi:hypothetical protein
LGCDCEGTLAEVDAVFVMVAVGFSAAPDSWYIGDARRSFGSVGGGGLIATGGFNGFCAAPSPANDAGLFMASEPVSMVLWLRNRLESTVEQQAGRVFISSSEHRWIDYGRGGRSGDDATLLVLGNSTGRRRMHARGGGRGIANDASQTNHDQGNHFFF